MRSNFIWGLMAAATIAVFAAFYLGVPEHFIFIGFVALVVAVVAAGNIRFAKNRKKRDEDIK